MLEVLGLYLTNQRVFNIAHVCFSKNCYWHQLQQFSFSFADLRPSSHFSRHSAAICRCAFGNLFRVSRMLSFDDRRWHSYYRSRILEAFYFKDPRNSLVHWLLVIPSTCSINKFNFRMSLNLKVQYPCAFYRTGAVSAGGTHKAIKIIILE